MSTHAPQIRSLHRRRRQHQRQRRRITTRLISVFALFASVVWAPGSSAQDVDPPVGDPMPAPALVAEPGTADEPADVALDELAIVDERVALCAAWNAVESTFSLPTDTVTAVNALDDALSRPAPPGLELALDDLRQSISTINNSMDSLGGYIGGICRALEPTTIDFDGQILTVTGSCISTPVIGAQDHHFVLRGPDFFGVLTFHSDEDSLFVTITTDTDVWESSLVTTEEFGVGFVTFFEPDDSDPRQVRVDFDLADVPVEACDNLPVCRDLLATWDALILLTEAQNRLEGSTGASPIETGAIEEDLGFLANIVTFCLPPTAMTIEEHLANGSDPADEDPGHRPDDVGRLTV